MMPTTVRHAPARRRWKPTHVTMTMRPIYMPRLSVAAAGMIDSAHTPTTMKRYVERSRHSTYAKISASGKIIEYTLPYVFA